MLDHKKLERIQTEVVSILQAAREKQGLSMSQVAERAGLSQPMVSLVERRMRKPTLDTMLRIAAALELDAAEVLAQAQRASARGKGR